MYVVKLKAQRQAQESPGPEVLDSDGEPRDKAASPVKFPFYLAL